MAAYRRPGNYSRPGVRRRRGLNPLVPVVGTVVIVALVVIIALIARGGSDDQVTFDSSSNGDALVKVISEGLATPTPEPTAEPTPTPEPTHEPAANYGIALPSPTEAGYLPIVRRADTDEKIIAITVDDCFQFKNTRTIIDLIISNGGNFTLFPIGTNILREELYDTLHYAYELGVEIENHTYEHRPHYNRTDEAMARQVYMNKACLDYVLNLDYQQHFFRPMGGDGRDDQRLHIYCDQLGMKAIAWWSVSASDLDTNSIKKTLAPGHIYLFHTTNKDLAKLQEFVPYAVSQGYKLVTLNEMFGLPKNEVKELDMPVTEREIPQIGEYTLNPHTYKDGDYAWMAFLIQQRLIELKYLDGEPDGIYGPGTAKALSKFQTDNGLPATGEADPTTQKVLVKEAEATPAPTVEPSEEPADGSVG